MDAPHLSERPNVEFPEYPGYPNHRMRTKIQRFRKEHASELHDPSMVETAEALLKNMTLIWWREECENAYAEGILKAVKEQAYTSQIKPKFKTDTYLVTVNPAPSVQLHELKQSVEQYVDMKFVKEVDLVYEQRADTEETAGKGMHVHMLVKTNTNNADFQKRTRPKFEHLVGIPDLHVDIRPVHPAHIADKRNYMRGNKTGEGKAEKVVIDRVWRIKNNLNNYYTYRDGTWKEDQEDVHTSTEDNPQGSSECCADTV